MSDGSLELTLSPLPKYTVYKITIGLSNPVSKVSAVLEIARVREAAHSVFVTLEWVRTPPDTNTSQWEQKVEESVANQIQDQFHFQPWRLSVELTIQQDQPYSVHIKVCLIVVVVVVIIIVVIVVVLVVVVVIVYVSSVAAS